MNTEILLSGIGLAVAFALMAILIFKQISPIIIGPIAAIVVCITSKLPVFETVTTTYMEGVMGFFVSYFFIFLLGNIFGSIYQVTGAARQIGALISNKFGAKYAMLACMIPAAILSYGGINSFVIIFAVYPIALKIFEDADLPTRLLPGIVCGGMWTFAMTGPFAPQIPNIVSMKYLGTPAYAGLLPGICSSLFMAVTIVIYMNYRCKQARLRGEHFEWPEGVAHAEEDAPAPNGWIALIPIVLVLVLFNISNLDIVICLLIGIAVALVLFWKYLPAWSELKEVMNDSALTSITVITNTAVIVGFGSVVKGISFYAFAIDTLIGSEANPYIIAAVGANIFAGILGSASGGISLVYETIGDTFLDYASNGYNINFIHRLAADGCGGLDSLPWNGSIVSVFAICHTTHKKSYLDAFITGLVIPMLATFAIDLPIILLLG